LVWYARTAWRSESDGLRFGSGVIVCAEAGSFPSAAHDASDASPSFNARPRVGFGRTEG